MFLRNFEKNRHLKEILGRFWGNLKNYSGKS